MLGWHMWRERRSVRAVSVSCDWAGTRKGDRARDRLRKEIKSLSSLPEE